MSSCTSLSTQLKELTNLHSDLEKSLESGKLPESKQLKEQIKTATTALELSLLSNQEQVIKEKLDLDFNLQLSIYNQLGQTKWSKDILSHKEHLIKKIFNNLESTKLKYKEGMRPILMPGRETQRANWEQSLKQLKPYWREGGEAVNESYVWSTEYQSVLNKNEAWNQIPNEPYIVWTKPSQTVDPETTSKTVEDQKKLVAKKHKDKPNLYDQTDLHPLEYASLQVMHTYQLSHIKKSSEDVIPLDYSGLNGKYSYTRFVACPLSASGIVLRSDFYPGHREVSFRYDGVGADSDYGFRLLGRV